MAFAASMSEMPLYADPAAYEPKVIKRCTYCRAVLNRYNDGQTCWPCQRKGLSDLTKIPDTEHLRSDRARRALLSERALVAMQQLGEFSLHTLSDALGCNATQVQYPVTMAMKDGKVEKVPGRKVYTDRGYTYTPVRWRWIG